MIKIKSVTIQAALIMGAFTIIAAIIGLYGYSDKSSEVTNASGNVVGVGKTGDITIGNYTINTINYNVPETATGEAIKRLDEIENRVNQTEGKVELTREEIRFLSQALKELDQRTSGIEKLPDGRTKFGNIIAGFPTIVAQEHNLSLELAKAGNYTGAFIHIQNAIRLYEDSKKEDASAAYYQHLTGTGEYIIYNLGRWISQQLGNNSLAYEYAKKADEGESTPNSKEQLAIALYNVGKYKEALEYIEKALQAEPNNSEFLEVKKLILLKLQ